MCRDPDHDVKLEVRGLIGVTIHGTVGPTGLGPLRRLGFS